MLTFFGSLKIVIYWDLLFCSFNIPQEVLQKMCFGQVVPIRHRWQDGWGPRMTFLLSRNLVLFLFPGTPSSFCLQFLFFLAHYSEANPTHYVISSIRILPCIFEIRILFLFTINNTIITSKNVNSFLVTNICYCYFIVLIESGPNLDSYIVIGWYLSLFWLFWFLPHLCFVLFWRF